MYVLLIIAIYSDSCVEKTLIYYPHITKKCDICDMIQIETIFDILVKGFIIGVVVSAPLGPVGVLCIQRTLNKGRWYGFVTGAGSLVERYSIRFAHRLWDEFCVRLYQ